MLLAYHVAHRLEFSCIYEKRARFSCTLIKKMAVPHGLRLVYRGKAIPVALGVGMGLFSMSSLYTHASMVSFLKYLRASHDREMLAQEQRLMDASRDTEVTYKIMLCFVASRRVNHESAQNVRDIHTHCTVLHA